MTVVAPLGRGLAARSPSLLTVGRQIARRLNAAADGRHFMIASSRDRRGALCEFRAAAASRRLLSLALSRLDRNPPGGGGVQTRCKIRYDTVRDAVLTCARKPTRVSLIHRTEPTTTKCKTEKLKSKNGYAQK